MLSFGNKVVILFRRRAMLRIIVFIQGFTRRLQKDHASAYSAQTAYFIILSAMPFIMFILTLLHYLPLDGQNFTDALLSLLPTETHALALTIINEIYGKTTGTLLSISVIILLWTACKGIMALTNGLNAAYEIDETRNYFHLRLQAVLYTLIFAIMIIFTMVFLVFGNRIYAWISGRLPWLNETAALLISLRTLFSILLLTFFFAMFFKFLPNKQLKFIKQLPGALISAAGWSLCSYFFSIYVDFSKNLSYIYGSLAGIIVLMLWLYFCMYIVFIGAEVNHLIYLHDHPQEEVLIKY